MLTKERIAEVIKFENSLGKSRFRPATNPKGRTVTVCLRIARHKHTGERSVIQFEPDENGLPIIDPNSEWEIVSP